MGAMNPLDILTAGAGGLGGIVNTALPLVGQVTRLAGAIDKLSGNAADEERKLLGREQALALKQLKQKQRQQISTLEEATALDKERLAADANAAEKSRLSALRRAVSRQSADFESRGLTLGDKGSNEAILLGLFEESEDDKQQRDRLDGLRNRALDQDVTTKKQLNILQRNQLLQQQNLQRTIKGF